MTPKSAEPRDPTPPEKIPSSPADQASKTDDEDLLAYLDVPAAAPELPPPPKLEFDVDLPDVGAESELAAELGSLRSVGKDETAAPEELDRHLPDLRVNLSEAQLAGQLAPTFEAAHPSAGSLDELASSGPASNEPVTKVIEVDDTPREAPAAAPGRVRRVARALGHIWNGPLGWAEQTSPPTSLVVAKVSLRLAIFGALPIGLALALGFFAQGGLYASHSPSVGDPALLWSRAVVEFAPPDQQVQIDDGSFVSSRLLDQLSSLYGNVWPDITAAIQNGDTSTGLRLLPGVLSGQALATYQAQATSAHARGLVLQLYGPGQYSDQLLFLTATPASAPNVITAYDGYISIYFADSPGPSGNIVSQADYSGVQATFSLGTDGAWHLSALSFDPL